MSNIGGFFHHPWQSIGGVFTHPGHVVSSSLKALPTGLKNVVNPQRMIGGKIGQVMNHPGQTPVGKWGAKNPLLVVAIAADVLTYGGATGWVASLATASSGYLNAAAAGTYASGAAHGFNGLRTEMSTGPSKADYITGAEFAAAYGVGTYEGATGFSAFAKGFGTIRAGLGMLGGLGVGVPAPKLGPGFTPADLTNAQLQADLTGQPIQYTGQTSASGGTSGTGAPGSGGPMTPGGGSPSMAGLAALAMLGFVAVEA